MQEFKFLKKGTFLMLILNTLITHQIHGQIVLTKENIPKNGETYFFSSTTLNAPIDFQINGRSLNWDFSNYEDDRTLDTLYVLHPSNSPSFDSFPNAKFAIHTILYNPTTLHRNSFYTYYEATDSGMFDMGMYWNPDLMGDRAYRNFPYDVKYAFPLKISNTLKSRYYYAFPPFSSDSAGTDSMFYKIYNTRQDTVIGEGTLHLKAGSFQALLIKSTTPADSVIKYIKNDSTNWEWKEIEHFIGNTYIRYIWVVPHTTIPYLEYNPQSDIYPQGPFIRYYKAKFTSLENHLTFQDISVFPNPFTDYIQIKSSNKNHQLEYSIHTIFGEEIMHGKFVNDGDIIDFTGFEKGIYFLKIGGGTTNSNQYLNYKVVKL